MEPYKVFVNEDLSKGGSIPYHPHCATSHQSSGMFDSKTCLSGKPIEPSEQVDLTDVGFTVFVIQVCKKEEKQTLR